MSSFTTPADMRIHDENEWELLSPFYYHVGEYPSEDIIKVPAGFITDLASVPRIFWPICPPQGKYSKAAIIHDYMYVVAYRSKEYADNVFYEAMGVLGVPKWKRKIMYLAVKYFGKGNYK